MFTTVLFQCVLAIIAWEAIKWFFKYLGKSITFYWKNLWKV